ncbi:sensor histidine kinase [Cellulomonas sp. NPDC058312]|uniref:sensor histidine kinase n=1 Tax=Cellulomonas sp. NPDC058312 TaxID=3346441 RepID=UPI0036EFBA11
MTTASAAEPARTRAPGWLGAALAAAVVGLFLLATPPEVLPVGLPGQGLPLLWVSGAACVGAVVLAHRHPAVATGVGLLPLAGEPWTGLFVWGWLLGLIAVMAVAAARSWRAALPAWGASVAVAAWYCGSGVRAVLPIGLVDAGSTSGGRILVLGLYVLWITGVLAAVAALGAVGRTGGVQRAAAAQERHALEVASVAQERARMARDLHDVVAHHVSLIAVRAESAPYQHPDLDPAAREVLAAVAEDARQAIGELRHALSVLRRTEVDDGTDARGARRPQPGAADVGALLTEARGAGQRVEVTDPTGDAGGDDIWGGIAAAQGYVLYRALQEGLTNARRHAPGATVDVTRTRAHGRVGFVMGNPWAGVTPSGPPGRGLIGMRERVDAVGGALTSGVEAGRFVLRVDLPDGVDA